MALEWIDFLSNVAASLIPKAVFCSFKQGAVMNKQSHMYNIALPSISLHGLCSEESE